MSVGHLSANPTRQKVCSQQGEQCLTAKILHYPLVHFHPDLVFESVDIGVVDAP
jgi:hypothetical protein